MAFLPTNEESGRGQVGPAAQYWAEVKRNREDLRHSLSHSIKCSCGTTNTRHAPTCDLSRVEDCVFLTSLAVPLKGCVAGSVCEASTEIAARRMSDLTHRLSTAEEIAEFKTAQKDRLQRIKEQDRAIAESQGRIVTQAPAQGNTLVLTQEALKAALSPELLKQMGYVPANAKSNKDAPQSPAQGGNN